MIIKHNLFFQLTFILFQVTKMVLKNNKNILVSLIYYYNCIDFISVLIILVHQFKFN